MNCRKLFFAGLLGTLSALSPAAAQNLVANGGFEDSLKGWGNANATVFEVTTGQPAEGAHFVAIQSPDSAEKTLRRVVGGLTAGQDYTLTVKTRKNTITDLRIVVRNTASKAYVSMIKPLPSDAWQASTRTFKAPGTEVGLEISVRAAGSCDLDDITIVPGKSAPSSSLAPVQAPAGASTTPDTSKAEAGAKPQEPFADQIAAFEAFDKVNPPKPGAVVFVGSSTIKRWSTLAKHFPEVTVVNRGFGGARMRDVVAYAERIVIPLKASHILVYAGDNDLAGKETPQDVLSDFKAFVAKVRAAQPETPITFIAVKPSPHRLRIIAKMAEANRLIQDYTKGDPKLGFVDITATVLGPDGNPDPALFEKDGLHLNEAGYDRFAVPIRTRVLALK